VPIQLENYLKGEDVSRHASVVQKLNWVGCYYQDPKNMFANFAVDHETLNELWDELTIDPEGYRKLREQKTGTVVGEQLMKQFGWKVGQRITLTGTFYPINPQLDIVGTFKARNIRQEVQLFFRWDYFDELMQNRKIVGTYWIKARGAEDVPRLKELIDGYTKNSSDPTETLTEKEFAVQFMEMMGNVRGMVGGVSGIVIFIMIMMTSNTMAMSVRERVTEVAVMRTLGFSAGAVFFLVMAESILVSILATAIPVALSFLAFNVLQLSPSPLYFPIFIPLATTYGLAFGVALFCGVTSSAVPAYRSAARKIVDGLRQVV
jgi:putative ABC transport system permease protein